MTEITDEMVHRALTGMHVSSHDNEWSDFALREMRRALEAALNPPKEPEVEVTEAMLDAVYGVCPSASYTYRQDLPAIYRAMYAARPKEDGRAWTGPYQPHSRGGDKTGYFGQGTHLHRRKGDPQ